MADVVIEVHGTRARFTGLGAEALEAVKNATTYRVEGAFFAALARGLPYAAAAKVKDTATFLRWAPESRVHTLPTGLVGAALAAIEGAGAEVSVRDCRPQLPPRKDFGFEADMRRYQLEAVRDFTVAGGTGIFKHSVRSGKTRSAARVIAAYGVPTVFIVTSQILLRQAQEVLSSLLTRARVTCVGEGDRDVSGDVVVCTVQALLKARERKDKAWRAIAHRSLVVVDECVARGSRVLLGDGSTKAIEDVVPGDFVWTPLGPRHVRAVKNNGVRKVVAVKTEDGGCLRVTPEHMMAVEGISDEPIQGRETHRETGRRMEEAGAWMAAAETGPRSRRVFRVPEAHHDQQQGSAQNQLRGQRGSPPSHAGEQPDVGCRGESTSLEEVPSASRFGASDSVRRPAMGQRERDDAGREASTRSFVGNGILVEPRGPDWKAEGVGMAHALQVGPREPSMESCGGNRRNLTCDSATSSLGREEGRSPLFSRLDDPAGRGAQEDGDYRSLVAARDGACVGSRVCSVDADGEVEVFDLDVDEAHCFVSNGFLVHNCHHLERADRWVATVLQIAASVRLGLSATVWPDEEVTQEDLFLKACTGDIVSEVSMADVMSLGFLVPCTVRTREIDEPSGSSLSYGPVMLDKMIYENKVRNAAIVEEVIRSHEEGYRGIIVTTNRVAHAERLAKQLNAAHMEARHLVGAHADVARQGVLEQLRKRQIDCVVSTVLSEGVDIPECSVVIAGEGGRSRRAALQRMRCLTPAEGKERALFVDFVDSGNPTTADHSAARIGAYEGEGCFDMERV